MFECDGVAFWSSVVWGAEAGKVIETREHKGDFKGGECYREMNSRHASLCQSQQTIASFGGVVGRHLHFYACQSRRIYLSRRLLMLKELFAALVFGFAITGQIHAQEIVVAREEKPNPSPRVAPVTKARGSELETATKMKSASTTLTVEQMRMAGALAAERQKKQTPAEQMRSVGGFSLQGAKATTLAAQQKTETRVEQASGRDQETKREALQVITKEKTAEKTQTAAHYSYKTPAGKKESVPVIAHYYPKRIVYPFAKIDRHIDGKLMRAATIAQERAHAHSRSMCWHYVKEALLASGVIDSRPKSELAKDAAQDLVNNYGFKKLSVSDPFAAPVGSVLVYGANHAAGHVEIRTQDGFVTDFFSKTPSPRPLLGVYAKL